MKAIININYREALRAGSNTEGKTEIDFDPAFFTPEQRIELAKASYDSQKKASEINFGYIDSKIIDKLPAVGVANIDTLKLLIDARIAARKVIADEEKKEKEFKKQKDIKIIEKWMFNPDTHVEYNLNYSHWKIRRPSIHYNEKNYFSIVTGFKEALEDAESLVFWTDLNDEIGKMLTKKRDKKEKQQKADERAAKKAAREKQIQDFVTKTGSANQKARLVEKLLPDDEIIDAIRSSAYEKLNAWPRYQKLKNSDICDCEYEICDVDFSVDTKESATAEEFEQLQALRKIIPTAKIEIREHTGESEICENTVKRTGFMVRLTVGAFEFSREYDTK